MNRYMIESKAGVIFGVYEGETKRDALLAMLAESGDEYGDEGVGTEADWIITPVEVSIADIVDHGVEHAEDYAKLTVSVSVNLDGREFQLNYQAADDYGYQPTSSFALGTASGDDSDDLADAIGGDGFEVIESLARQEAQKAADAFFASMAV